MRTIILDVHGTLNEMVEGFIRFYEIPNELLKTWPRGEYDLRKTVGRGFIDDVRDPDYLGPDFWAKLRPTPEWALFYELTKIQPIMLCSRDRDESCAVGTFIWCNRWMPGVPITFTGGKLKADHFPKESQADLLLVDDSDEEINAWAGPTLLIPKIWNSGHATADANNVGTHVATRLLEALKDEQ